MAGRSRLRPGKLGTVTIVPTRSGRFTGRAYTRDGSGEMHRLRSTQSSEQAVREDLQNQAAACLHVKGLLGPQSPMNEALALWIADRTGQVRPQSLRIYKDTIRWLGDYVGAVPLSEFRPPMLRRLLKRIEQERSSGGADHARSALNGALWIAVNEEAIESNPLLLVRTQVQKKSLPVSLNVVQVSALRRAYREREQRVARYTGSSVFVLGWTIEVMLATGLRALRNQGCR